MVEQGIESNVVLYYYPGCLIGHVSRNMKDYCKSTDQCRRVQLLQHFVGGIDTTIVGNVSHNCCDVCTRECTCRVPCPFIAQHSQLPEKSEESADNEIFRVVTQEQKEELRVRLVKFREAVICMAREKCENMSAYVGTDFVCGLPLEMIESVVENCEYLSDSFDVEEKCLVWNYMCMQEIFLGLLKVYVIRLM